MHKFFKNILPREEQADAQKKRLHYVLSGGKNTDKNTTN